MSLLAARGHPCLTLAWLVFVLFAVSTAHTAEKLLLDDLLLDCLQNSPEILAAQARARAAGYRVPQAKALPDPMFMLGYQNEGFREITLGKEQNAMGMFSISQKFPFPGKRGLKGEMAARDAQTAAADYQTILLRVVNKVREAYYDLFLAHKTIDILKERTSLFTQIEEAAAARYSSGMGMQQEVVMAQTEKYMLLEREEMQRQRIQALQGMLNAASGRPVITPLGRPVEPVRTVYEHTLDELLATAKENSPEIKSKERMVAAAETRVQIAKKEYYPDITLQAGYFPKTDGLLDMWNLTASVDLPLFFRSKQRQALFEARELLFAAKREVLATEYMLLSNLRESYSMLEAADRLMTLYREGLIPKTSQDVQLSLSGYVTGRTEAITVISRLKAFLDFELLFWTQHVEREKAIARLKAISGKDPFLRPEAERSRNQTPAKGEKR
jgi:outer membrane protein TolC